MNGYDVLASLLGSLFGSGIVLAVVNHSFSKRLEQLKTTLSAELFERQTKFAWLHTERSKVLVKLYERTQFQKT